MSATIETVTSPHRLHDLEEPLWDLFARDAHATPFQSPAWLLSWVDCFARPDSLLALLWWHGQHLSAFLPLWSDKEAQGSLYRLVGAGIGDYLDALLDSNRPDLLASLAQEMTGLLGHGDATIELADLRPGARLLGLSPWFRHRSQVSATCPVLPIEGSFDSYRRARPLGLRRNLRRTEKHLRSLGRVEFRVAGASNVGALMETFLDLHASRWRGKPQASVLADSAVRRFHLGAAAGLLAHDLLELLVLCLDDCPVAMAYVLCRHERFMYLTAFDPALAEVSLGSAIIAESIARAFRAQAPRIDFLRGQEPYKYDFGGRDQDSLRLLLEAGRTPELGATP